MRYVSGGTGRLQSDPSRSQSESGFGRAAGELVEDPVDIAVPLMGTQQLGELDRLIDSHIRRDRGGKKDLVGTDTQDGELHRIDLGDGPVEHTVECGIDLTNMGGYTLHQVVEQLQIELEAEFGIDRGIILRATQ